MFAYVGPVAHEREINKPKWARSGKLAHSPVDRGHRDVTNWSNSTGEKYINISMNGKLDLSRRKFLGRTALAAGGLVLSHKGVLAAAEANVPASYDKAMVAISLDLEMVRNFPR